MKKSSFFLFILMSTVTPLLAQANLGQLYLQIEKTDNESRKAIMADSKNFKQLLTQLQQQDSSLLRVVDKQNRLSSAYIPPNLINLDTIPYLTVNRKGHFLRAEVIPSLQKMSQAAQTDGVTLLISSTYRSYPYQEELYARWVRQLGQKQADRVSAPPGASQHQLGTAVDFGSIEPDFTGTKAQLWLQKNAYKYGWSLSFPKGFEDETGYMYESWHYRYIGLEAALLQEQFFNHLQYKLLNFFA